MLCLKSGPPWAEEVHKKEHGQRAQDEELWMQSVASSTEIGSICTSNSDAEGIIPKLLLNIWYQI